MFLFFDLLHFFSLSLHATNCRMLTIQADSKVEHRTWLNGLIHYCPRAAINRVQTQDLSAIRARDEQAKDNLSSHRADVKECSDDASYDGSANTAGSGRSSGSGSRRRGDREKGKRPDHRKEKYMNSGQGATSRLHASIRNGDTSFDEKQQNECSSEEERLDNNDTNPPIVEKLESQTLPHAYKMKSSSEKSIALKANCGEQEHIDTVDLNAMHTRKPRKFRNPRGLYADDDFDDERETSGLDYSDVTINNDNSPKAEEKTVTGDVITENTPASSLVAIGTPDRDSKGAGGGRKAKDGVFSPDDTKGEAKGVRKLSADEIIKQKSSGLLDVSMDDDKENQLDLRAEKTRYDEACESKALADLSQGSSRPPPGPRTAAYNDGYTNWSNGSGAVNRPSTERSSTPPRKAGNPGTVVDNNFVDDDWDNDKYSNGKQGSRFQKQFTRGVDAKEIPRRLKVEDPPRIINGEVFKGGDTRPDEDFLDADWD